MTSNQIAYANMRIEEAKQLETARHDMATEDLGYKTLDESHRHNIMDEMIGMRNAKTNEENANTNFMNAITNRRNAATNARNAESNYLQARSAWQNAQTNSRMANIAYINAQTQARAVDVQAYNARINAQNAATNARNARTNAQNAKSNRMNAKTQQRESNTHFAAYLADKEIRGAQQKAQQKRWESQTSIDWNRTWVDAFKAAGSVGGVIAKVLLA
jgi:hypothetical protein